MKAGVSGDGSSRRRGRPAPASVDVQHAARLAERSGQLRAGRGEDQRRRAVGEDVRELALAGLRVERDDGTPAASAPTTATQVSSVGRRPHGDARGRLHDGGDDARRAGELARSSARGLPKRIASRSPRLGQGGQQRFVDDRCVLDGHDDLLRTDQPIPTTTNSSQTTSGATSMMIAP